MELDDLVGRSVEVSRKFPAAFTDDLETNAGNGAENLCLGRAVETKPVSFLTGRPFSSESTIRTQISSPGGN